MVEVLNEALATELVCYLRYKRHFFMADGINAAAAAAEFLEHANQELGHADQLAARITQLQGEPNFSPDTLTARSHAEYVEGDDLVSMIKEDLIAERIAIESYQEIARWLGDKDSTTRRLMEEILAVEEEHADDLVSLLTKSLALTPDLDAVAARGTALDDAGPTALDAGPIELGRGQLARAGHSREVVHPPGARVVEGRALGAVAVPVADAGARPSGSLRRAP